MSLYLLLPIVFFVSLLGSAIQAATGFGYGIFMMSVLPFFLPYTHALCTSGIVAVVTAADIALKHRKHINFKLILYPLLGYLVVSTFGTYFLKGMADETLKKFLGAFLVILSVYLMWLNEKIRIEANVLSGGIAGGLGGFLGSVFGMGGPPIAIYMLAATTQAAAYIANIQVYFACTNVYLSFIRWVGGMIDLKVLMYTAAGILGVSWGARIGDALFRRMDGRSLRMVVYSFMILTGTLLLVTE